MSDSSRPRDFLSLSSHYPFEDDLRRNPVQPALDTLFSEFARRHRSLSPSTQSSPRSLRGNGRPGQPPVPKSSMIDLRNLDYTSEYDSHLMCPICHIPFIEPVVLDCDHTFCASCFSEYRYGATGSDRSQCPSCRAYVLSSPRKASRLIHNMCNEIKVRCPNESCSLIVARGSIEHHATKDCPEQKLSCPDVKCEKQTKRKNYVPGQCIHDEKMEVECDCGARIRLGRGEWLKHKDSECPSTCMKCERCGERVSIEAHLASDTAHVCQTGDQEHICPGVEFGCSEDLSHDTFQTHIASCTFARIAPYLKTQSRLLQSVQDQLTQSKVRNQNLDAELDRLNNLLSNQIQPRLDQLTLATHSADIRHDDHLHDQEADIEEIPRDNIPSAAAIHHRDLLLPAHIRDLTPSPDLFSASHDPAVHQTHMHNHLLSLHESLRHTVSSLEVEVNSIHHAMRELDARTSMQLMNETLRIKEDLAYTNAALVSHRSQVQWLLNRERMGREQAILRERGRMGSQTQVQRSQNQGPGANEVVTERPVPTSANASGHQQSQFESFPFPSPGAAMTRTVSGSGSGSGPSSAATSPMFTALGLVGGSVGSTRRPSMRGGSQERVKL